MKKIAIIPARGGSKRIPRKNIKVFYGKPIIGYAINLAKRSNIFDCVMVSTEDEEIKKIAKSYGAEVPFLRNKKNASDFATTYDVLEEVINWYKKEGHEFDYGCCIYPITPLLKETTIKIAFEKLNNGNYDSLIPVTPFSHPIQRALYMDNVDLLKVKDEDSFMQNTQNLPTYYHDTGQFYWFNPSVCMLKKKLMTDNTTSLILSSDQYQDVDNQDDWELMKLKYQKNQNDKKE